MALKNKDIAKQLNISPAAVSLALNNKAGVSEETRQRVMKLRKLALEQTLYTVDQESGKRRNILLSIHKKHGAVIAETPFFLSLTETIQQEAARAGYGVSISHYNSSVGSENHLALLKDEKIAGVLLLATEMQEDDLPAYRALGKPLVLLDSWFANERMNAVLIDNMQGILQVVDYVYACGHRKIGFLNSKAKANNFTERFMAYCWGLQKYGIPFRAGYVFDVYPTMERADGDMLRILENDPELPTVLIAANDIIAFGAAKALKLKGYSIPGDISITGFDDMPMAQYFEPPLTSVHIGNETIGRLAVKELLQLVEKKNDYQESLHMLVEAILVERSSVRHVKT